MKYSLRPISNLYHKERCGHKHMKKIFTVMLLMLSLFLLLAPITSAADVSLVYDDAQLLTYEEQSQLNIQAEAITEQYQCDVAIITVDGMGSYSDAYAYAKNLYQEYDFGYGTEKSGVLLLLSEAERDYALIAYGYGNTAFTDHGKDVMLDNHILPLLSEDAYYEAFTAYLDKADEYLSMARAGEAFDVNNDEVLLTQNATNTRRAKWAVTIILPLIIASLICGIWKRQMKTAVAAREASQYIPEGGFHLTAQEDQFLYRTETRRKIERQSSSGGTTKDSSGFSGRSGKY